MLTDHTPPAHTHSQRLIGEVISSMIQDLSTEVYNLNPTESLAKIVAYASSLSAGVARSAPFVALMHTAAADVEGWWAATDQTLGIPQGMKGGHQVFSTKLKQQLGQISSSMVGFVICSCVFALTTML
jgi:hypothetical protein